MTKHDQPLFASLGFIQRFRSLFTAIVRPPPPLLGDGRGSSEVQTTGLIQDLASQAKRIPENFDLVMALAKSLADGGLIDDRQYVVEKIVQLAASLPDHSENQVKLTGQLIRSLWNVLQHPPMQYLSNPGAVAEPEGKTTDIRYRSADGSYNNPFLPTLGMAGTPYAKSVTGKTMLPVDLPDPGMLFDLLFAREKIVEHPTKTSSMLFYLATIIIHDIFRTSPLDNNKSSTSSYLDLAPLYGNNLAEVKAMRTLKNGMLKADTFNESRLLGFPPGVSAFLIAFNRFHNYAAGQLAIINEGGRFTKPTLKPEVTKEESEAYEKAMSNYDEHLFQTARLVTTGLYINIILNDYVKNILNFNRSTSSWTLDPRGNFGQMYDQSTMIPAGVGNAVSVEFNLIYRWHACVSTRDEKWTEDFFKDEMGVSDASKISIEQLQAKLKEWGHSIARDPGQRNIHGWRRDENGKIADKDLVEELIRSTEDVAGSFGPKNIPKVLRSVEILGIIQARKWNVATLNEFRQFCQLKPHNSFEDINPDPEIAQKLRTMYDHPDRVELYPGILAEDAKKALVPGSGLCPGFTVSKAILSDAVALSRGDRFYTTDASPANLTNWGWNEVASNPEIAQGRVLYKLLMTAFPGWYKFNSVYSLYPFTVPEETKVIMEGFGTAANYNFDRPTFTPPPTPILSYSEAKEVIIDNKRFFVPWGQKIYGLTAQDYMLSGDKQWNYDQKDRFWKCLYSPENGIKEITKFYEDVTRRMIKEKSYAVPGGFRLNSVRDIGNPMQAHFFSALFSIPIKTQETPHGVFTEQEIYDMTSAQFAWTFLDSDPVRSLQLQQAAQKATETIRPVITDVCKAIKHGAPLLQRHPRDENGIVSIFGKHLISKLLEGRSVEEITVALITTAAGGIATQSHQFALLLEFYLSPKNAKHWAKIKSLAASNTPEAFEQIRRYVLEGMRLSPAGQGVVRHYVGTESTTIGSTEVKPGDNVFVNFITANLDPKVFPNPMEIDLTRDEKSYIGQGMGVHKCLGLPITSVAMASMLKTFAGLAGLRLERQEGMRGKTVHGVRSFLGENGESWSVFPNSMKVRFDGLL
ncbi:fatty acid oxygenase, partial [Pyronema omphalodes]